MAESAPWKLATSRLKSRNHLDFLPSRFVAEPVIGGAFARSVGSLASTTVNVPVVPTLMGWGAIPDDHVLMAGMVGLQTIQNP